MITEVAIKIGTTIYSLPAPNRHHNIIWKLAEEGIELPDDDIQGFLTDEGKFLDRFEALGYALKHNQVKDVNNIRANRLFSEDLW